MIRIKNKRGDSRFLLVLTLFIIMTITLSGFVFAVDNVINNTRPNITVKYEEFIDSSTLDATIEDENGKKYKVSLNDFLIANDESTFIYKPDRELGVGEYIFYVKACDVLGNCGQYWKGEFEVELPELVVEWKKPLFGMYSTDRVNIELETNRKSICRYSKVNNIKFSNMEGVTSSGSNYVRKHIFNNVGEKNKKLYFKCVDKFNDEATLEKTLIYDSEAPQIEVSAEDVYSTTSTKLEIKVINDKQVLCRYSKEDSIPFDKMIKIHPDEGYNIENENSYKKELFERLYLDKNPIRSDLEDGKINTFYVMCISKAGKFSNLENVDIDVNSNKKIDIRFKNPSRYLNTSSVVIDISTSIDTKCNYEIDEDNKKYNGRFAKNNEFSKNHETSSSVRFDEGKNYIGVRCSGTDVNIKAIEDIDFYVDLSDPIMKYVNIIKNNNSSNEINEQNKINFEFGAEDNISGLKYYEYMIYEQGDYLSVNITDWITINTDKQDSKYLALVTLKPQHKYYVEMRAVDNAYRKSSTYMSDFVIYSYDNTTKGNLCTGFDGACLVGEPCLYNSDCESFSCNGDVCIAATCTDAIKNNGESDIDCSGLCDKCDLGSSCEIDDDCESGICDSGKCSTGGACNNGKKDGTETDVDCGGSCNGCDIGQICLDGGDCLSENCKPGEAFGLCFEPGLDTDGDGILDDVDNCIRNSNPDQADFDLDGIGDVCDPDKDNDGLPDDWEERNGLDPYNKDDADGDKDNDGLSNFEEFSMGTSPIDSDSDGDGYNDYDEYYKYDTDPTDKESHPKSLIAFFVVSILFMLFGILLGYYVYYAKQNNWEASFGFLNKDKIESEYDVRNLENRKKELDNNKVKSRTTQYHHDDNAKEMMPLPKKMPIKKKVHNVSVKSNQANVMPANIKQGLNKLVKPKSNFDKLKKVDISDETSKAMGLDKIIKHQKASSFDKISKELSVEENLVEKHKQEIGLNSLSGIIKKDKGAISNLDSLAKSKGLGEDALSKLGNKENNDKDAFKDLDKMEGKDDSFNALKKMKKKK